MIIMRHELGDSRLVVESYAVDRGSVDELVNTYVHSLTRFIIATQDNLENLKVSNSFDTLAKEFIA